MQRPAVAPPAPAPDTTTVVLPAETTVVTPAPVPAPPAAEPSKPEPVKVVDTPAPAPAAQPTPPREFDPGRQRYANTWANVRSERSSTAAVLQVLDRGEIVAVDSLEGGWYRVTTDRPVTGYVDQQFLDTLPPGAP